METTNEQEKNLMEAPVQETPAQEPETVEVPEVVKEFAAAVEEAPAAEEAPAPEPTYVEATNEAPEAAPAEEVAPVEVKAQEEPAFVPEKELPIHRSLSKMILFGLLTLGIYNIVIVTKISREINIVASPHDGRKTMNALWIIFLLCPLTGGLAAIFWLNYLCERIGKELKRREIPYSFSEADFWLWNVLGALICVGPFVFVHKWMHAMNLMNADYNQKG